MFLTEILIIQSAIKLLCPAEANVYKPVICLGPTPFINDHHFDRNKV